MKKLFSLLMVALLVLCSCTQNSDSGYNDALDLFLEVFYEGDFSRARELAPDAFWDYCEKDTDITYDDLIKQLNDLEYSKEVVDKFKEKYGEDYTISFKIIEKEIPGDQEFDSIASDVSYNIGNNNVNVNDAIKCKIEITAKGSKNEITQTDDFLFVEVGGKWYVYYNNVGFSAVGLFLVISDW